MALKLPTIPTLDEPSELINLVANAPKWKERMEQLVGIYDKIKKELDSYLALRNMEERESDAQATIAQAQRMMTEAREADDKAKAIVAESQKSANEFREQAEKENALVVAKLRADRISLEAMRDDLMEREAIVADNTKRLNAEAERLAVQRGDVSKMYAEAVAIRDEYTNKMEKLKALV